MSKSQWNQDIFCAKILDEKFGINKDGYYCDVGATDGVKINNTLLFAERGWNGICVEPHPDVFADLKQNRESEKCAVFNEACYDTETEVQFLANTGYTMELSGIVDEYDPRHLQRIRGEQNSMGGSGRVVTVKARPLDDMLDAAGAPAMIDFLSVDVEGGELKVLQGFLRHHARVVTIEDNYPDNSSVHKLMLSRGYTFVTRLGGDNVYVTLPE